MSENWSAHLARFGINSPNSSPGVHVWMGLSSPRISAGASGLRSYMSIWLGPPSSQSRMQFTSRPLRFAPWASWLASHWGRLMPRAERLPIWSSSRRETFPAGPCLIPEWRVNIETVCSNQYCFAVLIDSHIQEAKHFAQYHLRLSFEFRPIASSFSVYPDQVMWAPWVST